MLCVLFWIGTYAGRRQRMSGGGQYEFWKDLPSAGRKKERLKA
jgi:hypothetical protein